IERALRAGFTDGPVYRGSWRLGSSGGLFGIGCFDESGICRSDVRCNGPALADRWYPANAGSSLQQFKIGRANVCTPVTNAHLVCRLLLEKKKTRPFIL